MIGYYPWFLPENFHARMLNFFTCDLWQLSQLILPLVAAVVYVAYFRRQNLSLVRLQPRVS